MSIKSIPLTLPRQVVQPWSADLEIPMGRHAILHVDVPEGEHATVVLGRVRAVK